MKCYFWNITKTFKQWNLSEKFNIQWDTTIIFVKHRFLKIWKNTHFYSTSISFWADELLIWFIQQYVSSINPSLVEKCAQINCNLEFAFWEILMHINELHLKIPKCQNILEKKILSKFGKTATISWILFRTVIPLKSIYLDTVTGCYETHFFEKRMFYFYFLIFIITYITIRCTQHASFVIA